MMLRLQLILSIGVLTSLFHRSVAVTCDLKPRGAVGDPNVSVTKYRIVLVNSPEKYVQGQTYNVILQGKKSVVGEPNKFNGFALTVEPAERNENLSVFGPLAAGVFKLLPEEKYAKIDENCPNTIVHTSLTFIPSVEVLWTAPSPGIGCVRFRASVMEQHMWYKNNGGLELKLCEQESFNEDSREKCCSCNEAKYEMKFEGLWTRQSHPRYYPENSWLTRFSDVIGASHAYDYSCPKVIPGLHKEGQSWSNIGEAIRNPQVAPENEEGQYCDATLRKLRNASMRAVWPMVEPQRCPPNVARELLHHGCSTSRFWKENEKASPGLIDFSEREVTTLLESEIKSNKTRTVIKAKGLSHPNITDKTFAVFRVDQEHHLLSLISIIRPSPDWFVGISGLSLCDDKCGWTGQRTLDLYPYDLGLYADLTYESKAMPKEDVIRLIDHTNMEESPFYTDSKDKLKPLARVHLIKAREYEKQCDQNSQTENNNNPDARSPPYEGELPAPTRKPSFPSRENAPDYTDSSIGFGQTKLSEQDEIMKLKCVQAPFSESTECSRPECDRDRVKIVYRKLEDGMRETCMKWNDIEMERLEPCKENCSRGKSPPTETLKDKCTANKFPPSFNPCDLRRCSRNRTRTATDPSKKSDRDCLRVIWSQEIDCQPQDCNKR